MYKKKKTVSENEGENFKACLVEKGYSQKHGVNYDEIFSPVVRHTSIRTMFSFTAYFEMELEQMDVKTTFLHGELEETVYMVQPKGSTQHGHEHLVYVDDILIFAKSMRKVKKLKILLSREFEMEDLDVVKKILGMEIFRDKSLGRLWLSQSGYFR